MVASNRRLCAVFAFVFAFAFPILASAATADFRVLFDVDNNAATGCTDSGIAGIEQILVTRINTTDTSAQVTRMYRQACSAGVFGAPADLDLTARPAGFNSPSGLIFAESRIAYSALTNGALPLGMRLYFDASDGFSAQSVMARANGDSIFYPATDIPKRHSVGQGGNPRMIVLDGQVGDWNGINPLVVGVAANGTNAVRILKIYAYANPVDRFLYFRFDGFIDNSNPYAQDDTYARKIGEGLNVVAPGVLSNDGDPSGKPLTATPVSPAEHGNVTLNPDGSFTYAPNDPTSFTSDKFDYKANNGSKDSNVARVTINVSINPSQSPVAVDDAYQTGEDTTLNVSAPGVLQNDIDPDGPSLSATLLTDPLHGTVTLSNNGAFTYMPAANYSGTDTFTYRVSDGTNSDDAVVTITIGAVNDTPKANNLAVTTAEDNPVNITLSATDTEGGTLTYNINPPSNGTLSGTPPNLTYTPFPNYFGPDSFTYTVTDSGGKISNIATVSITVTPVNDPPSFTPGGNVSSNEDTPFSAPWASNVSAGPANESGQPLTFNITNNTNPGLFSVGPSITVSGTTGTLSYTPALNANGSANITVTLSDGVAITAPVTFTITINPINDPPTINVAANLNYTEGNGAVVIDNTVTVTDPDSNITTATIQITANYVTGEDILAFVNNFGITGAFNALTGTLTLTGPASPANFESALRTVTYQNTSAAPSTAPRTLTWTVNDPQPSSASDTSTITITAINTAPLLTAGGTLNYTENQAPTAIDTTITASDTDSSTFIGATVQITTNYVNGEDVLSYVPALGITGTFNALTGTLTLTGTASVADYQTALRNVLYNNTSENPSTSARTVVWQVNDGGSSNNFSNQPTSTINITPVNDPPVLTAGNTRNYTEGDAPLQLEPALTITDPDSTNAQCVLPTDCYVIINNNPDAGNEVLACPACGPFTPAFVGSMLSFTGAGTLAQLEAAMRSVTYAITTDNPSTAQRGLDWYAKDSAGAQNANTVLNDTLINVTAVNDAPVNTVPGTQTFNEDTTLTFSTGNGNAVSVADADLGGGMIQVSLATTAGTLTLSGTTGLSFSFSDANGTGAGDGTADASMTFRGTLTDVNNALQGMTFTPTADLNGAQTISMTSNDLGNSGSGGALTDNDTINLSITAVNDAPVITRPAAISVDEDTVFVFNSGNVVSIADVDAGAGLVQVSLSVTNGTLTLSTTAGLSFSFSDANGTGAGDGTSDATMTFRGTLTNVNAALNGMTYLGNSNYNGADTLNIGTNDLGNTGSGGALTDAESTAITVNAVNDAPVNTVPGTQTFNEDTTLTFSTGNGNAVSVADVDLGAGNIQVSLSTTAGTLTLSGTTGLSFSFSDANGTGAGDGTADASMTFRGTLTDVNNALQGMTFTPTLNIDGAQTISMMSNDLGNTGSGGALTDSDTINLSITAANDAPVNTVPGAQNTNEDTPLTFSSGNGNVISISDPDAGAAIVQVALSVTNGTLTLSGTTGLSFSFSDANGTGAGDGTADAAMTFRGTISNINAALNGLTYTPNLDSSSGDTLSITTNDLGNTGSGGALTDNDTVTITITAQNDAPVNTVPGTQTFNEDTTLTFSTGNGNAISVADADVGGGNITVTLSTTAGTLAFGSTTGLSGVTNNAATITGTGTLADINNALQGLTFTPTLNIDGPQTISFTSNDNGNTGAGGPQSDNDTINLSITAVNDAPVITRPVAIVVNEDTAFTFNGGNVISIADVDAGAGNVQVSLSVTNGMLSLNNLSGLSFSFSDANGTGTGDGASDASMTFRGSLTDVNNALNGMVYVGNSNFSGADTLNIGANDLGNTGTGGALTDSESTGITVNSSNDAPVNTVPGTQTFNEDTTLTFSTGNGNAISVADADVGGGNVTVTLSTTAGTLAFGSTTGLSGVTNNAATITGTGTLTDINNALQGLTFTPTLNLNGPQTISFTSNDNGNTGAGGPQSDNDTINLSITAVNDGPVNTVPGMQTINQDTAFTFNGANQISVADVDLGGGNIQITLTATNGVVSLSGTTGLSFSFSDANGTGAGDGTTDPTMTFRGSLTDVNNALNGLIFNPTPGFFSGPNANVAIVSNDLGNTGTGGALTDSDSVNIFVQQVNQAPVNSVPGAQTINEDATLTFSAGNSNLISISDPDAGVNVVQVQLTVTNGTLTLNGTTGLSFVFSDGNGTGAGDGTADATMTFRGTISDINTALNGLVYTPNLNFNPTDTLTITTNDLGNTGPGGPQTDTDNVTINITAVNDAPVNTVPGTQTFNEDTTLTFSTGNGNAISVADADAGGGNVTVTLSTTAGTMAFGSTVGLSGVTNNAATITGTGTLTDINNALQGLTFTPTLNISGAQTISFTSNDNGNTGSGGPQSDNDTINLSITAVNDAPVNTVPGTQTFNEDTTLTFSTGNGNAISVADVDVGGGNVTVTLSTTAGTMAFGSTAGLSGVTNNAATITGTGTLTDINNALQGLTFTPTLNLNGPQTISFTSNDNGNTGSGGPQSDNDTINLSITAVNDAPVLTTPASVNATEDVQTGSIAISVTDVDSGAGTNFQATLSVTSGTINVVPSGATVGGNNTNSVTITGTVAQVNTALGTTKYTGNLNFNGTDTMVVNVTDNGQTGSGGPLTDGPDNITINVAAVNDKPVALAKVFSAQAHMKIVGLTGLLTGVTDPDHNTGTPNCTSTTFTVNTITPITGGTVSNINTSTGTFDFSPAAGFTGAASLTYTVDDTGCPGVATSDPQTITINVAGPPIYFVKSVAVGTGDCTLGNECTLATAIPLATGAAGRHIFISDANTHTPGVNITLNTGGHLMGQGVTPPVDGDGVLTNDFDDLFDISPPSGTIARPAINAARPTVTNSTITLNTNSQLRGLNVDVAVSPAVTATGRTGLKITDMNITSNGNAAGTFALDLGTSSGDFTIGTVIINPTRNGSAVRFASTTSANTVTIGNITTEGGQGFSASSTGTTNFTLNNVTSTSGVAVTTSSTSSGNFTFNDVTSTTGTAVSVTTATGAFSFHAINANGATTGMSVTGATGTFIVNGTSTTDGTGGTIQNCTRIGGDFRTSSGVTLKNMNFTNNGTGNGPGANCEDIVSGTTNNGPTNCNSNLSLLTMTNVTLDNINATLGDQIGIDGQSVNGLTMTGVSVQQNGGEVGEDGVQMANLSGTVSISGTSVFKDNAANQFEIVNSTGVMNATVNNSEFSITNFPAACGGVAPSPGNCTANSGLYLLGTSAGSSTMNLTVINTLFQNMYSYGAGLNLANTAGSTFNIGTTGNPNTFTNNGIAIFVGNTGSGTTNYNLIDNTMTNNTAVTSTFGTTQISVSMGGSGTRTGVINNNNIGTNNAGATASGCFVAGCDGIQVTDSGATGTHNLTVTNNDIYHVSGAAIRVTSTSSSADTFRARVANNIANYPDNASSVTAGILVQDGNTSPNGVFYTCVDITGNNIQGLWAAGSTHKSAIRILATRAQQFSLTNFNTGTEYPAGAVTGTCTTQCTGAVGTDGNAADFISQQNPLTITAQTSSGGSSASQNRVAASAAWTGAVGSCP